MNFDLDDTQREFARSAAEFYADQNSVALARTALEDGASPAPGLKSLTELGFYGITVPESAGGIGLALLDLAVVAEQAGRFLAAPSLVTAARAAVLLDGDDERLAALADGSTAYTVVDGPLTGSAPAIDARTASAFLGLDGDALIIGSGTVTGGKPLDATRGLGSVRLDDGEVLLSNASSRWQQARQVGAIVLAAESLGAAARAVEIGVDYAKTRETFGRAIGSYQAVKHPLVDAYVGVEQLRSLVWWAAWTADNEPTELPLASSVVAAYSARVLEQAATTLIQVHGGIGFTWEHDAHLYWRRAQVDRLLLGDEIEHLDRVADIALTRGAL
jgi:alkylation response protein AidB-like acyl-CoA dehydrogenase